MGAVVSCAASVGARAPATARGRCSRRKAREKLPEKSESPRHAPKERRKPAAYHCAGKRRSTTTAAKASVSSPSALRPNAREAPNTPHISAARSEETVNPQKAQYPKASSQDGIHAKRPSLRKSSIAAPNSTPMCRPETAKMCAMPPFRTVSLSPSSMTPELPESSA